MALYKVLYPLSIGDLIYIRSSNRVKNMIFKFCVKNADGHLGLRTYQSHLYD